MAVMSATRTIDTHAAVLDLRVQEYGRGRSDQVRDPIIEPMWSGLRVLAAFDRQRGVAFAEDGVLVEGHDDVAADLATALAADAAIVDGVLFKPDRYDAAAASRAKDPTPPAAKYVTQTLFGKRRNTRKEAEERLRLEDAARDILPDEPVAFVGFDLLALDDQSLLDVPLLERRRLLDAVLSEDDGLLVRRGVYVRAPVNPWLGSWRALGFSGIVFKAANGRYQPGGVKDDWVQMSMPPR
jgi:hypothetical protein